MEMELDIGLKRDWLKIPKKWIGGSIRVVGVRRKKKMGKKVRTKTKDFLVFSFEFLDPILSQVFLQDSVQKCGLQRATSHLESYEICSLRRSLHVRLKQSKKEGSWH
jgi:hypothetical protein